MRAGKALNYYSILKVRPDAGADEIKKAYRRMAFLCHPDRAGEEGTGRFLLLKEAHDTLSDSARKAVYDRGLAGAGGPSQRVNHDLSFVREYIKKTGGSASGPSSVSGVCSMCGGRGRRRDMFGVRRICRWCGGTGARRI
ncbi:MAG: DnaJ domain-containing protein [Candidatus Nitrospinota bacterium M3_3B_026]